MQFAKAVKYDAKARIALVGPSGSGKSMTSLEIATYLAGPDGKIAALDTEHGSLSKYADKYSFSVFEPTYYTIPVFLDALKSAIDGGFSVFCVDSLSHFWMGAGGALEFVDAATKRSTRGDSFGAWKDYRAEERKMLDAILAAPIHIIVTMRTKSAYEMQKNDKGKMVRVKVGLAPIQTDGLEYEFDLVGYMDDENSLIVDKTRCPDYGSAVINRPKGEDFDKFSAWLKGEKKPLPWGEKAPYDKGFTPTFIDNKLSIQVRRALDRVTKDGKTPFIFLQFYEKFENHNGIICFDNNEEQKTFDLLHNCEGEKCKFIIEEGKENTWIIKEIVNIGGEEITPKKPKETKKSREPDKAKKDDLVSDDIPF